LFVYLWQGLLLGGTAAAQPGPFQVYLLGQTLKNGWRRTLLASFAPLLSDGPIILLVLLVLTQTPDWFLRGLQIVGGFFLLYLAFKAWRAYRTAVFKQPEIDEGAAQQSIFEAALMNALSPNPTIFWSTIAGPILLQSWRLSSGYGLSFLLGFYGALIGGFMAFVLFFAAAGSINPRVNRLLTLFSAVALFSFGLYQLSQALL